MIGPYSTPSVAGSLETEASSVVTGLEIPERIRTERHFTSLKGNFLRWERRGVFPWTGTIDTSI